MSGRMEEAQTRSQRRSIELRTFLTQLRIEPSDDPNWPWPWRLLEPFNYITDAGQLISIPKDFGTDFASIPRLFWPILPPWDPKYGKPAVLHDYLYRFRIGKRSWADYIFLEAMEELKVPVWKMEVMYLAVRLFGGPAWRH